MDALRAQGDVEREAWAVVRLGNARKKVKEKEDTILELERSVGRMEGIMLRRQR